LCKLGTIGDQDLIDSPRNFSGCAGNATAKNQRRHRTVTA
jgi:hypothetical protein